MADLHAPSLSSSDLEYVRTLLRERAGLVLEADKEYLVETRLAELAREERLRSAAELLRRLYLTGPTSALARRVVEAMATTETYFFRDRHPFDALRDEVLPALLARRAAARTLHIWSASCASGQEPYSVALLIREHFTEALDGWTVRILGTDISRAMLARARRALYSAFEVGRGLPDAYSTAYFRRTGGGFRLRDDVRRMVEFRELNLAAPWPVLPWMDVILLRNVLIYLDDETRRRVLANTLELLRPDGYLMLGASEGALDLGGVFEPVSVGRALLLRPAGRRAA